MITPRAQLISWIEKYAKNNLYVKCSSELEYYVFNQTNEKILSKHIPNLVSSKMSNFPDYSNASISDRNEKKFNRIVTNNLLNAGVEIEAHFSEYGPGQQEVNIHYDEPLKSADSHVITKQCIKNTIEDLGLGCSFMAKPFTNLSGSSGHVHISVYDDKTGKSLFCSSENEDENFIISEGVKCNKKLVYFIGGLIKYIKEVFLIFAMNVNSYRRFKKYSFAPIHLNSWGYENRHVSFRIIGRDEDLHLEVRIGGADINPYIVYSVIMAAGLEGMLEKIEPPSIDKGNTYSKDPACRVSPPNSLKESIELFEKSEFAIKTFGKNYHECLLLLAKNEWAIFEAEVTDWEIKRYLEFA
jgi:glutamine synthetase